MGVVLLLARFGDTVLDAGYVSSGFFPDIGNEQTSGRSALIAQSGISESGFARELQGLL
jgi:hypothetical protein